MIDFTTEFGQRVAQQLKSEQVIWLTTIDSGNIPQPRPVWFLWDGTSILIYSQREAYKLPHIVHNPKVALNFNTDFAGDEVAVMLGEARLAPDTSPAIDNPTYIEKYDKAIINIEMTPTTFSEDYSVPVIVTPNRLRGF